MKWLKISALLVAVLVSMRLASWAIGGLLAKIASGRQKRVVVIANSACFGLFALFLFRDLSPGEPVDLTALLFGLIIFAAYCTCDLFWRPWKS